MSSDLKKTIRTILGLLLWLFGTMFLLLCLRQLVNGNDVLGWIIHVGQAVVAILVGTWLIPETSLREFWDRTFSK